VQLQAHTVLNLNFIMILRLRRARESESDHPSANQQEAKSASAPKPCGSHLSRSYVFPNKAIVEQTHCIFGREAKGT
jgi:hypothetical protein